MCTSCHVGLFFYQAIAALECQECTNECFIASMTVLQDTPRPLPAAAAAATASTACCDLRETTNGDGCCYCCCCCVCCRAEAGDGPECHIIDLKQANLL